MKHDLMMYMDVDYPPIGQIIGVRFRESSFSINRTQRCVAPSSTL